MTYDHWKITDEHLGDPPPPCEQSYAGRTHQHPRYPSGYCVECGAEAHQGCKYREATPEHTCMDNWEGTGTW